MNPTAGAIQGLVHDASGRGIPGVTVVLSDTATHRQVHAVTNANGIFRLLDVPPASYEIQASGKDWEAYRSVEFPIVAGDVKLFAITLVPGAGAAAVPTWRGVGPPPQTASELIGLYRELPRAETAPVPTEAQAATPITDLFVRTPDRWEIQMPQWERYPRNKGEFPYTKSHWWDPFNRNKLKGDYPIIGQQTFFNFTGTSDTLIDGRRLPVPSGISAANPGSFQFFGQGGQFFLSETFRFSFDLFHGDAAYKPADWRIRITPAVNVNYIKTREQGLVNIDVREGTDRTDAHLGVQEAFVEKRVHDFGPNFDFVSVRAGIQQFSSDFRGFLFVEEQPGIRLFGNLRSNRFEYNLAYFYFLEKDTNSLLNRFERRHQQVWLANLYIQDFLTKGYTTEFSFHFNRDQPSVKFDNNGFLVRPAPIGGVIESQSPFQIQPHEVDVAYAGWTGNGHIGRINVSHAFYQAFGHEDRNLIAQKPTYINAQMAALELSIDKDWTRFKTSFFYASGDSNPRDGIAHGFDSIVDSPVFAGGIFSFFNRESIRLTSTGVQIMGQDSFYPSLRSNKFQGQANFVNPGLMLWNVGTDLDIKPKLQTFINANFLRFVHTQPLELLLFQTPIRAGIGGDYSVGIKYRPPLTDNIVVTSGVSALTPWSGFRDIFSGRVLFSTFANVRFKF